jgi:hypothetical protein
MSEIIDKSNKRVNMFFTNTPYHILLAIALANNNLIKNKNRFANNLIIVDNFNGAAIYKKSLELWKNNPFNKIWILNSDSSKTRLSHYITERKKVNEIKRIIKNSKPIFLYTNNDVSNIGKAIIMSSKNYNTKCIYIEDGIEPYLNNDKGKKLSQFRLMMQKIIYGKHSMYVPFHGANPGIDEIHCNYPELIDRKKYASKKIVKIDFSIYKIFEDLNFVKILLSFMKIDITKITKIKYIFVLPHSDFIKQNPLYFEKYKSFLKKYVNSKSNNIAIKYHPREKNIGYFSLKNSNIYYIPKILSMEFLYFILKRKASESIEIFGLRSTSLMTSRIILPDSEIYMLNIPSNNKKYSYTKYEKIGIKFINIE